VQFKEHRRRREAQRPIKGEVLMDKETARRVRFIRWRRLIIVATIVVLVVGSTALYLSPVLRVQKVQVVGTTAVSQDEIRSLAQINDHSMLRVDLDAAERRVESIPIVQDARLERHWPQSVRISITERTPWALWQIGDAQYAIDSDGVVLPGTAPIANSPVIHDVTGQARLTPGDHVDRDAVAVSKALLQRVPETLALTIGALEYTPQQGLALTTNAGYRVVVGDSQNLEYKLAVWKAIEERLGRGTMAGHVLDLRFGDRPSFQ
jgi:cell division protein FtsQ